MINVQQMIDQLNDVDDKSLPVYVYIADMEDVNEDINEIWMIDKSITDRVDINIG